MFFKYLYRYQLYTPAAHASDFYPLISSGHLNRALSMEMSTKQKPKTVRGFIFFRAGEWFPFVSDMRHKLLNVSSVRQSTNPQFTNKEFSVHGSRLLCPEPGEIVCKLAHCNVFWEGGCKGWSLAFVCWRHVCVLCCVVCVWYWVCLNKTCPVTMKLTTGLHHL